MLVVGRARFELAVSWSQTRRFTELSHRPTLCSPSHRASTTSKIMSGSGARARNRATRLPQGVWVATAGSPIPPCGTESAVLAAAELLLAEVDCAADTEPLGGAEPAPLEAFAVLQAAITTTVNASETIKRVPTLPFTVRRSYIERNKNSNWVCSYRRSRAADSSRARTARARWLYRRFSSGDISPKVFPVPGTRKIGS
jgi:hypothetical protein